MATLFDKIIAAGVQQDNISVHLSLDLVRLLSEQLYSSPLKAIEELVVNAYDADAAECRVYIPESPGDSDAFIVVYDNGTGMDAQGLQNLWEIGRSYKREEYMTKIRKRKQIGKFGIGKLAAYPIANKMTYISKVKDDPLVRIVSFWFDRLHEKEEKINLPLYEIELEQLKTNEEFQKIIRAVDLDVETLAQEDSWTFVVLEDLKENAAKIRLGRLRRVLSYAMPLQNDFILRLNGERIESVKLSFEPLAEFEISEIGNIEHRLKDLQDRTQETWRIDGEKIVSDSFPQGIWGRVVVTHESLRGKSDDLGRSHGFFVKVRGRLINHDDPLFGLSPLPHGFFNRLYAEVHADDLDEILVSSRESVNESDLKNKFQEVLRVIGNEALQRYEKATNEQKKGGEEGVKQFVVPDLIEIPTADVLLAYKKTPIGAEADETWFYIDTSVFENPEDLDDLIQQLYQSVYQSDEVRRKFNIVRTKKGATGRLVQFDPRTYTLFINEEHPFIKDRDSNESPQTIEDVLIAEILLEVYLREAEIHPHIIGQILEKRDRLFRGLADDRANTPKGIAKKLRDAKNDPHDLEIALVLAARKLGFTAKQISGRGEPDGIARYRSYAGRSEVVITLEAKSSTKSQVELSHLDFAGLESHKVRYGAAGCLLIAPGYPGAQNPESEVSKRARNHRISCWTIEDLARVVEASEERYINAKHILDIVTEAFAPQDVRERVERLLTTPKWNRPDLYRKILMVLENFDEPSRLDGINSSTFMGLLATKGSGFYTPEVDRKEIQKALSAMAAASKGGMMYRDDDDRLELFVDLNELKRRLASLLDASGPSVQISNLLNEPSAPEDEGKKTEEEDGKEKH